MNFSYKLMRGVLKGIGKIPFGMLYGISDGISFMLYHVVRYRRKVVDKNLTECFPEKSPEEIRRIRKDFYRNFTDVILEAAKMGSMSNAEISGRMRFPNIDEVESELEKGRSIGLFLGHYGNWEWISSIPLHLKKRDVVMAQIYRRLSNPAVDALMLENRSAHGATNIEMRSTARFITGIAAEGKESIIGFIADQSPRRNDIGLYVPFLNHMTPAQEGTEKIMRHYGYECWFVDVKKIKRGYYEAEFVKMSEHPEKLPKFRLTEMYYEMLENMIRRKPELYLWTHRRFKYAKELPDATPATTPTPENQ